MKVNHAMILAAGFGLRLKPLTDTVPKALVPYRDKPMIENVINKLIGAGIKNITVNTHYFAEHVRDYFEAKDFGIQVNLTYEKNILGTGGGIKNSKKYLTGSGNFIVHNVDVVSDIDLNALAQFHQNNDALATLAVKDRETGRSLLMDAGNNLIGRASGDVPENYFKTAFCGIYILSERVFDIFPDDENFDIITFLLEAVKKGEKVICYDAGDVFWKDLGRIADLNN